MSAAEQQPAPLPAHVATPATSMFLALLDSGQAADALKVLDVHWMEIWFAIDPTDLRTLLAGLPESAYADFDNVDYVNALTGAALPRPSRRDDDPDLLDIGREITDLRLKGRPEAAIALFPQIASSARELRGRLVDATGGLYALWLVQAGITHLLAGEVNAARSALWEAATGSHHPERVPFIEGEAQAKLALTHAVVGDVPRAGEWAERAQARTCTGSWVEAMIDDTLWLVDYICAVDSLDFERAEQMRLAKPSPLNHLEFWGPALQAHVRHLVLTGRPNQARDLCDETARAGLPPPGSDGWIARFIDEARLLPVPAATPPVGDDPAVPNVVAHRAHLLGTGQFTALAEPIPAVPDHPEPDARPWLALRLLRAQGLLHAGREDAGRPLLRATLAEIFERGTLGVLRYLTGDTLRLAGQEPLVARAAELIGRHGLPTVRPVAVLDAPLTPAESQVLHLLRDGLSRGQIATTLFLSANTVKSHLRTAYRKLGVSSRDQAVTRMDELGL